MIGLSLDKALELLKEKKVKIIYNTSDKLASKDAQLVCGYKEENNQVILIVSDFKLGVKGE